MVEAIRVSDNQLVESYKAGNREALGEIYERHVRGLYTYLYHLLGNVQSAEDTISETFEMAIQAMERFEPISENSCKTWLFTIAANRGRNQLRNNGRKAAKTTRVALLNDTETYFGTNIGDKDAVDPQDGVEREEENAQLRAMVAKLSPERQELLLLKIVADLPNKEVGQIMGRSEGAVKALYIRTLDAIRDQIQASPESSLYEKLGNSKNGKKGK